MQKIILSLLIMMVCCPLFAHQDRIERAAKISVAFGSDESAVFELLGDGTIFSAAIRTKTNVYNIPAAVCAKLKDVNFAKLEFLWNGSYPTSEKADYFYLCFPMGNDADRAFGELPEVTLMFRSGVFSEATVKRKISNTSWQVGIKI